MVKKDAVLKGRNDIRGECKERKHKETGETTYAVIASGARAFFLLVSNRAGTVQKGEEANDPWASQALCKRVLSLTSHPEV